MRTNLPILVKDEISHTSRKPDERKKERNKEGFEDANSVLYVVEDWWGLGLILFCEQTKQDFSLASSYMLIEASLWTSVLEVQKF